MRPVTIDQQSGFLSRVALLLCPPELIFLLHFRVFAVEVIALFNHYQQTNRCQNIFKHDVYSYSALKNRSVLKNPAQRQHKLLDGIGLSMLQLTMATDRAFTDPVQPPDHAI